MEYLCIKKLMLQKYLNVSIWTNLIHCLLQWLFDLSAIRALMYLANYTRPDISFYVNLLARYSSSPTRRHWNRVKHIFRYLRGTMDMSLFYSKVPKLELTGYAGACYLSDSHNRRSQTGYLFKLEVHPFHGDM
jgi:hypothetical protein